MLTVYLILKGTFVVALVTAPLVNPRCRNGWCKYRDSWQDTTA